MVENQRELIIHYWNILNNAQQQRFQKEVQVGVLGYENKLDWQNHGIDQLKDNCSYLINVRGFESWQGA